MKVLICSDGTKQADTASQVGGELAAACKAETTLLGIAEEPKDKEPLRAALELEMQALRQLGLAPDLVVRDGDPIREIVQITETSNYDMVIIGSRRRGTSGVYWRSEKTYEVIKAVPPPVLVAIGGRLQFRRFLVCTGGKRYIDDAVKLTGDVAACAGAAVTLLHVMAEPPAIYSDLVRLEEDVDRLLASGSELGENLRLQKDSLEALGVATEIRVRHGLVLDQVFLEVSEGKHDVIVTGSSQTRGPFRHYIMGDLTREIVNRAPCPVLVARAGKLAEQAALHRSFWTRLKQAFAPPPTSSSNS
jgi:nucleotide-binding universal stress UspA family protein